MAEPTKKAFDALASDLDRLRKEVSDVRVLGKELRELGKEIRSAETILHKAKEAARQVADFEEMLMLTRSDCAGHDERLRDLESWREHATILVDNVQAQCSSLANKLTEIDDARVQNNPTRLQLLSETELYAEICKTLNEVLDDFEGGDGPSEHAVKDLWAEVDRRREALGG